METPFGDWWHEIIVSSPIAFAEALDAVKAVRQQRTVLLNLSGLDPALAQRIADFVAGGVDALDGHMHRMGDQVFLFSPSLVDVRKISPGKH